MKEYELDKSTGELTWTEELPYSPEFTYWYERIYLQSPSLCKLQYDDEKMWEAWKEGYKLAKTIHDNHMLTSSNKGFKNDLEL